MVRFGLVLLTWSMVTWNYYSFSHFVHHQIGHHGQPHGNHHPHDEDHHNNDEDHHHGGNPFEGIYLKKDELFLWGFALPLMLLTLASLIWNPSTKTNDVTTSVTKEKGFLASFFSIKKNWGDVNVHKWTIICYLLPLLFVMYDSAHLHNSSSRAQEKQMGWSWLIAIFMALMSPTGYAAVWALALFLIPVTKHSPILDWLRVTPVQALAFHRVAGWTSFWCSVSHGFLHLRHLMDVLNGRRPNPRPWYQELVILLVPSSWKCIGTQEPWQVFYGHHHQQESTPEFEQCRLALVNATGMISVLAYLVLAITSLPRVRRASYALFYTVHIPTAWIMLIAAIWHYPTCALVLIPNIIYYLSFNIPVYMTNKMDYWSTSWQLKRRNQTQKSQLIEANLIHGNVIELIFATSPKDEPRHDSRFARISHASVSSVSHPFSVFSPQDLNPCGGGQTADGAILLRSTGPFTKGLAKILFPSQMNSETHSQENEEEQIVSFSDPLIHEESDTSTHTGSHVSSPHKMIQFDSYYAGAFDWIDHAISSHDEILLVAGGVGIVPFLEFLPSLQKRICVDAARSSSNTAFDSIDDSYVDREALLVSNIVGPARIHLHWYCREVGLASYVWYKHLCHHVEQVWESSPTTLGRLKIHIHLTSLESTPSVIEGGEGEGCLAEEVLSRIPNTGLVQKHTYSVDGQDSIRHVEDARLTQSWYLGLLLPGSIMVTGTILHWWWYKKFIINDQFRYGNLIIRAYSLVFTVVFAVLVSALVEGYLRDRNNKTSKVREQYSHLEEDDSHPEDTTLNLDMKQQVVENNTGDLFLHRSEENNATPLAVTRGRPSMDTVIESILKADRPGVYICGPHPLMESVEGAIRDERSDCAFYREDSEM